MFESLELLEQIKKSCCLSNDELIEILQNIAYFITDNNKEYNEGDARYLLEDVIATIENNELW